MSDLVLQTKMIQVLKFLFTEVLYNTRGKHDATGFTIRQGDYKLSFKDYLTGKVMFYHIYFL